MIPQGLKPDASERASDESRLDLAASEAGLSHLLAEFRKTADDSFRPGSNNWVVSGQHTVSGKPLLSNDMHLDHQMPNLWFEAHLKNDERQLRRRRSYAAGSSVRHCRPQPAHRLGIHQRWADGGRRFHRRVQCAGAVQDSGGMGRSAAPAGDDSRQRQAGCDARRGDHAARTDHHAN